MTALLRDLLSNNFLFVGQFYGFVRVQRVSQKG